MDTQEIGTFASSLPKNAKRVRVHFWFSLFFCWIRFLYVGCSHLPSCLVFIPYVLCNIQCIRRLKMEEKEERNIRRVNREKRESGRYEEKMKRRTTSRRWRKKEEEKKRGKKANDEEEGDSLRGQRWREKENKESGRKKGGERNYTDRTACQAIKNSKENSMWPANKELWNVWLFHGQFYHFGHQGEYLFAPFDHHTQYA